MNINQELLSQEPTHRHTKWGLIKVFSGTHYFDSKGERIYSAELMEGDHKGKWAHVGASEIRPLYLRLVK